MASFPSLNYTSGDQGNLALATVHGAEVEAFHIGPYPRRSATGDDLKDILRDYGVPMTGNKEQVLEKLVALATTKYAEHLTELNRFFSQHRFLRMHAAPKNTFELPLLKDLTNLRNLVITMYAVKQLRGDTLLEADHINDTYTDEELAHALITGKLFQNVAIYAARDTRRIQGRTEETDISVSRRNKSGAKGLSLEVRS